MIGDVLKMSQNVANRLRVHSFVTLLQCAEKSICYRDRVSGIQGRMSLNYALRKQYFYMETVILIGGNVSQSQAKLKMHLGIVRYRIVAVIF